MTPGEFADHFGFAIGGIIGTIFIMLIIFLTNPPFETVLRNTLINGGAFTAGGVIVGIFSARNCFYPHHRHNKK